MSHPLHLQVALARWESEGGSVSVASRSITDWPSLPPGYEAQPAWGFRDRTGRFFYEFNRVYGPPNRLDKRGPVSLLDCDLSYWGVTWPTLSETGDERPAGRWVSYAQTRKRLGSRLTFERFSSLSHMREELPWILNIGNVGSQPHPDDIASSAPEVARRRGRVADPNPESEFSVEVGGALHGF